MNPKEETNKANRKLGELGSKKHKSPQDWIEYWGYKPRVDLIIRSLGSDGKSYRAIAWVEGGEVRVFKTPSISDTTVNLCIGAMENTLREFGLFNRIEIEYYGPHSSALKEINLSIDERGRLDIEKLSRILVAEDYRNPRKGGKPHADVIITDKYLSYGGRPQDMNWGSSNCLTGCMVLSLPGRRKHAYEFLPKITQHETTHLLGYNIHHDTVRVNEYNNDINCNMNWEASTLFTCPKCKNAVKSYWRGIDTYKQLIRELYKFEY